MSSATETYEAVRTVGNNCLCLRIQRASRAIGRHFDDAFRPLGLNNWQFSLLTSLNRPVPPTVNGLAEHLGMDRTTITANLKPLQRRGLVNTKRDDKDARVRRIVLTRAGRSLLAKAMEHWQEANESVAARFSARELASLHSALRTIADSQP